MMEGLVQAGTVAPCCPVNPRWVAVCPAILLCPYDLPLPREEPEL